MFYGLLGEHLPHSFSREIHREIGDYPYELCEVAPDQLDEFMRARNFRAINVTIPYKEKVIPYLKEISPAAERIGAVNTIVNRGGDLYGFNTDYLGLRALAEKAGIRFSGKKVLILGTGGTSKTALAVAKDGGAREVFRVSRSAREDALSYEDAFSLHADADILINTTPCGMFPNDDGKPVDLGHFPRLAGVLDVIYNPLRTELVLDAQSRGIPAKGGLYMLVAQGVAASDFFFDTRHTEEDVNAIYEKILSQKRIPVLIGMPSCGKTTVGARLANDLGWDFCDTDDLFAKETGLSPADYIRQNGQDAFRDKESEIIALASRRTRTVVAVGGGAVLRDKNVRELKKNGWLVWLDRSCDLLLPTPDRPLSDTPEKLKALYLERRPVYLAAADYTLRSDAEAPERAGIIKEKFRK